MSEWKEIKIKEITESANTGLDAIKRAPIVSYDSGIKCLRIQDVSQSKQYDDWGFCEVEERNFKRYQLRENEIIIARTGASIGVNKFIEEDVISVFNNGLIRIRTDEKKCLPKFLYYNFRTPYYNSFIESISGGTSTQPNMQINALLSFEIILPPLAEQIQIASVLSSLDDKIDLLHRQNKTLEALAETLFRQWFVEEAEEGWEEITLSDIAGHVKLSINPIKQPTTLFEHYSIPAFDDGQEPKKELGNEIRSNKYRVLPNTVLVSKLNPRTPRVWSVYGEVNEDCSICSTEFQVVKPKRSDYFGFIYCYLKSWNVMQELANAVGGTSGSHQRVNPEDIFNLTLRRPPLEKLKKFDRATNDYWEKIIRNRNQIRTLTRLRDTLLPKLMSGEVRVAKSALFEVSHD